MKSQTQGYAGGKGTGSNNPRITYMHNPCKNKRKAKKNKLSSNYRLRNGGGFFPFSLVFGFPSIGSKRSFSSCWFPSSSVTTTAGFTKLSGLTLTSAESSAGSLSLGSSTSSALRSHLRLLVYFPHPSTPRRPSLHFK